MLNKISNSKPVIKEFIIQERCHEKDVLDLGCIRHNADFILNNPDCLHNKIRRTAKSVLGVDCLADEVKRLRNSGYNIICADVTKRLNMEEQYDVIVAGDLIEHLINFEGFFDNCARLLKPDGILILTTPNPFYSGEYHYIAFKERFLVNPEHTCWIDPQCMMQLVGRFGFSIREAFYIKKSWRLEVIISQTKNNTYDILKDTWINNSFRFKLMRFFILKLFSLFYYPYKFLTIANSRLVKYSDYLVILEKQRS